MRTAAMENPRMRSQLNQTKGPAKFMYLLVMIGAEILRAPSS